VLWRSRSDRPDATYEALAALKPRSTRRRHGHRGLVSAISDGAAAMLV